MDLGKITPRIRQILQMSDLSTVSAKKVRRQLEHEMNIQLDGFKEEIDGMIKKEFQQLHSESQQRQHAHQQYFQQYAQQGPMGGVYGTSQMGLVPGYPGGVQPGMAMPGAVGSSPEQVPRKRGRPRKAETELKLERKRKRALDPNRPKRQTGLSKPMKLSDELRSFLDQKYFPRTEVVKSLWKYIKSNDLQDPADKRYILCDAKLKELFHTDRLYMYTMNKLLNEHLIKPTPEETAEANELLGLTPANPPAGDAGAQPPSQPPSQPGSAAPESPAAPSEDAAGSEAPNADSDRDEQPKREASAAPSPLALPPMPSSINSGSNNA
ncbi:hypothetical protein LPJ78_004263 [Coemansia sp. RSA 989]|nr:hypothetical protein BX667DRAFT_503819 [Coemansia mojavensis]KAJ1738687.1 hypothetical protein LPJ68_005343 [Coemansia sp. RSA 1086]KAJ1748993.1 hypothetical protein LPJ79_004092 [Coemansia sp. RSA 1821]KAJ1863091.1 hypothetical protein LPJ78_004263 [Coemansia sp. RSA 989]KAJ1869162.1 hypothetical protein LPJ55_005546 [Coemansia sp. RSA 990]KAJ2632825.1 hypothetical protein H4R22_000966 [Coemansia sp. RSA 1290]KAJ2649963.1 hypothetical protein IWW40_002818 [Coemansia sp. RSA 1250]KAJ26683